MGTNMKSNCGICIHKEVCKWRESVKTLYTDYEKMVEANASMCLPGYPIRYINDPFICESFCSDTINTPEDSVGCGTCKHGFVSTKDEPCVNCKNNYMLKWEAREDKDGE